MSQIVASWIGAKVTEAAKLMRDRSRVRPRGPTPTVLPGELYDMSWHETPLSYGGRVIGFNDQQDQIVVRECTYEGETLVCTDWVVLQRDHWQWLKHEVSKTMKW